ncbi:hypothetical protein [Methylobacterium sp. 22177]|uniref:hypothetical protein n=1 Tax=Methylobacterium sp. 22177 TaxID=3453885 RepID=UPI003F849D4F
MADFYGLNYASLTPDVVTNLFLYGKTTTPSDLNEQIRPSSEVGPTVHLNMGDYMRDGPGRYALPSNAAFVKSFFSSLDNQQINGQPISGTYTVDQLIKQFGVSEDEFKINIAQYAIDTKSSDYASRAYIYNSGSFIIAKDTQFVFDGQNSRIDNLHVRAFDDNFDFESSSWVTWAGNNTVLKPLVDPFGLGAGRPVIFKFDGTSGEPITNNYGASNYNSDAARWDSIYTPTAFASDLLPGILGIVDQLKSDKVIDYERDGKYVIYANSSGATISPENAGTANGRVDSSDDDHASILVGSPGNDKIYGGSHADWLLGGGGDDNLYGSLGGDFIDGGADYDVLTYSSVSGEIKLSSRPASDVPDGIDQNNGILKLSFDQSDDFDRIRGVENIRIGSSDVHLKLDSSALDDKTQTVIDGSGTNALLDFSDVDRSVEFNAGNLGESDGLIFNNFTEIKGSENGDTFDIGGTPITYLQGGAGNDTIRGNGQAAIDAGLGNNNVYGSDKGSDTFVYSGGNLVIDNAAADDHLMLRKSFLTGTDSNTDRSSAIPVTFGFMGEYDTTGFVDSGILKYDHTDHIDFGSDLPPFDMPVYKYNALYSDDFDFEIDYEKRDDGSLVLTFKKTTSYNDQDTIIPHRPIRDDVVGQITINNFHDGDLGINFAPATGGAIEPGSTTSYDHDNQLTMQALNNGNFLAAPMLHTDVT